MKQICNIVLGLGITSMFTGCADVRDPEYSTFGGGRVTAASANQMFDKGFESFDDRKLAKMIWSKEDDTAVAEVKKKGDPKSKADDTLTVEQALRRVYMSNTAGFATTRRARIQDRLIAASDQRCNVYMTYLKRIDTYTNLTFGSLTTILGGVGAIVTGVDAARILSGTAGISSGLRAETNQAFFSAVATSVIVPAIRQRRDELRDEIETRRTEHICSYTIEAAMADAIRYHGACSIDVGLDEAGRAVQERNDIGMKSFAKYAVDFNAAKDALERKPPTVVNSNTTTVGKDIKDTSPSIANATHNVLTAKEQISTDFSRAKSDYNKLVEAIREKKKKLVENTGAITKLDDINNKLEKPEPRFSGLLDDAEEVDAALTKLELEAQGASDCSVYAGLVRQLTLIRSEINRIQTDSSSIADSYIQEMKNITMSLEEINE